MDSANTFSVCKMYKTDEIFSFVTIPYPGSTFMMTTFAMPFFLLAIGAVSTSALPFWKCPGDLKYLFFGSSCSCDDPLPSLLSCPTRFSGGECMCPSGTVRLGSTSCVRLHLCPPNKKPLCPGDLVYRRAGVQCRITCGTRDRACVRMFVPTGCQCPTGKVLVGKDRCIRPEECPPKIETSPAPTSRQPMTCSGDLVYSECSSMCTLTCETRDRACIAMCGPPRCQCPGGTVSAGADICIPPEKCPVGVTTTTPSIYIGECSGDLVFKTCGSMCTFTCETKTMLCPMGCAAPRCQCPGGTVLVGKDTCIPPEKCPISVTTTTASTSVGECTGDLIFKTCGSMCTFTCETKTMLCPMGCAAPRCQCPGGTVLVGKDTCIPPEKCPASVTTTTPSTSVGKCSGDLVFKTCGSMCTFTCETKTMLCPMGCAAPRCQCPGGTVLVGQDKCIPPEQCPKIAETTAASTQPPTQCHGDLVFSKCGRMCTPTCDNPSLICTLGCAEARCQCPGGTVLFGEDRCFKPEQCPNRI